MNLHPRLARTLLVAATCTGFAVSGGTALANATDSALEHGSDNAPGGALTAVDDHRPAGAGEGRKIG